MVSKDDVWSKVCTFMHDEIGVVLKPDQVYLLQSRVAPVAQTEKFDSVESFALAACSLGAQPKLRMALVDALTTHESYFFRDAAFWDSLKTEVFAKFIAEKKTRLRIWSAACSYGQEAYSMIFFIQENFPDLLRMTEIVASDVSQAALDRGRQGIFSTTEVNRGLSAMRLVKHFEKAPGGFKVKDSLKGKITWTHENLLQVSHAANQFDIVLCRNVLIYFDVEHRKKALAHLLESTRKGGYIGLGTSEVLLTPQAAPGWFRVKP